MRSHRLKAQSHKTVAVLPLPPLTSHASLQIQVVSCASDQLAINWEVPTIPTWGLINLFDWLTESRKPNYFLDYRFITKAITQEQSER